MDNGFKDALLVNYKSRTVKFDLTYGYLDKVYEAFNFKTKKNQSIEQFVLHLDNEAMLDNQYLVLDDMSNQENKVFDVELNLDGFAYKGIGKISKFFSPRGLNINLHLLED